MMKIAPLLIAILLMRAAGAESVSDLVAHAAAHPLGDTPCSFNASAYTGDTRSFPIGVFDSGIGGLTVLQALLRIDAFDNDNLQPHADGRPDFAAEHFVYFGDQANMPYGNYPAAGRVDLLRELILRDAVFLLRKDERKPPVKAIVIACNTATAYGLEDIRAALKTWQIDLPVVGVVEAGARGVMEMLPSESRPDAIAVLATVGTCGCEAYPRAISRSTGLAGKPMPVIIQQGCVGLAGAIEGDPAFVCPTGQRTTPYQGPRPDALMKTIFDFQGDELATAADHVHQEVTSLVERHRQSGDDTPIGFVVLGCTHFPMVQAEIAAAFSHLRQYREADGKQPYAKLVREQLTFINPAEFTAKELFRELARRRLRLEAPSATTTDHEHFFMSVPNRDWPGIVLAPSGTLDPGYKHQRSLNDFARNDTPVVTMTPALLPTTSAAAIEHLLPEVWRRLTTTAP